MRRPIPRHIRDRVKLKYDGRCAYCGCIPEKICIDHLIPISSQNGSDDESNLMPSCYSCNNYKLVFTLEQFRYMLQEQVSMARKYSVNFRFAEKYGLVKELKKEIKFYFEELK